MYAGLSTRLHTRSCRPTPKIGANLLGAGPSSGAEDNGGFEPAKALVRGPPLPRPPHTRAV
ncbi:hypothetical protein PAXRUDRAFT_830277 [Paxillus rubicundulus Ve08.2h10]|uniref:Uncharacterized protein n=1 Tax=Paxillus rubicundulus Ve08.2h10 TaxID=930991 RepID=A0A0D0DTS6_9AGAM|nr:hypothetical protein PAXRUDRAFT_830277 [Paxillus rubicundulus Ve08.2h10]